MGDDLTAARRFCTTVRSDITSLMDGVCAQPCAAPDVLIGSLVSIQSGAKQLHARAIFRAAQTVVNAVNDRAPLPTVQGRLLSLNKLITQYEAGLTDIAPRPANGDLAQQIDVQAPAPVSTGPRGTCSDLDVRYAAARQALAPLMGFAKGPERQSLVQLADFKDAELAPAPKDTALDIQLETLFDDSSDPAVEAVMLSETLSPDDPDVQPLAAPDTESVRPHLLNDDVISQPLFTQPISVHSIRHIDSLRQIDFETLMPDFISLALQEARQTDKTVSVSYASEGVSLSKGQISAFHSVLGHVAKTLVSRVLERPETRRLRGESGAGHIAITATQTQDKVSVSIECPGKALTVSDFMPAAQSLEGLTITLGENAKEGHAHIILKASRKSRTPQSDASSQPKSTEIAS